MAWKYAYSCMWGYTAAYSRRSIGRILESRVHGFPRRYAARGLAYLSLHISLSSSLDDDGQGKGHIGVRVTVFVETELALSLA